MVSRVPSASGKTTQTPYYSVYSPVKQDGKIDPILSINPMGYPEIGGVNMLLFKIAELQLRFAMLFVQHQG